MTDCKVVAGACKTMYCDKFHRLSDGVPLNHKCRVLSPTFLKAEIDGDLEAMTDWFEHSYPIVIHEGALSPEHLEQQNDTQVG